MIQLNVIRFKCNSDMECQQEKIIVSTFIKGITYKEIINWNMQTELSFDDFSECDSGYCGL